MHYQLSVMYTRIGYFTPYVPSMLSRRAQVLTCVNMLTRLVPLREREHLSIQCDASQLNFQSALIPISQLDFSNQSPYSKVQSRLKSSAPSFEALNYLEWIKKWLQSGLFKWYRALHFIGASKFPD